MAQILPGLTGTLSLLPVILLNAEQPVCGAMRARTANLLRARQALSQLSYSPEEIEKLKLKIECERKYSRNEYDLTIRHVYQIFNFHF